MTVEAIIRIIADGAVVPAVLIGFYAMLFKVPKVQRLQVYTRVFLAGLTAYLIGRLAGALYQPSTLRPFEELGVDPGALYLNNPGFPSDHALFVTAILGAVWFGTRNKVLGGAVLGLLVLVSVGRVLALVHTPLDVIAGILFGIMGMIWYFVPWPTVLTRKGTGDGKSNR